MQVTETLADGLKRELTITIPATDLSSKLDDKLSSLKAGAPARFQAGKSASVSPEEDLWQAGHGRGDQTTR